MALLNSQSGLDHTDCKRNKLLGIDDLQTLLILYLISIKCHILSHIWKLKREFLYKKCLLLVL